MLTIRHQQVAALEQNASRHFEDAMVAHSKAFAPQLCEVIGDDQVRIAIRRAMTRAETYGFTFGGPVRLYIEMIFLCGSDFDTDPQYPAITRILRSPGDQMRRAEQLHAGVVDYQDNVSGPEAVFTLQALSNLLEMTRHPIRFTREDFGSGMLQEMHRIFPRRAVYLGDVALTSLIEEGRAEAARCQFTSVRAAALIVTLMFAFGHGCTADPLYPWIERTLTDDRIVDPTARADRLERKAVTWLEHVLNSPRQGAQS